MLHNLLDRRIQGCLFGYILILSMVLYCYNAFSWVIPSISKNYTYRQVKCYELTFHVVLDLIELLAKWASVLVLLPDRLWLQDQKL